LRGGTTTDRSAPVQVKGLAGVTNIAVHLGRSCAIKTDRTVWACNGNGELGNGTDWTSGDLFQATPVQVGGLTDVKSVYTSRWNGYGTYAIKNDGTLWAWAATATAT
jgi:alpha-tubulin suppressor-like RCC1 family protein